LEQKTEDRAENEEIWRKLLTFGVIRKEARAKRIMKLLPGNPRCKICYAPFSGAGSIVAWRVYHKRPSNLNPHLCTTCEEFARSHPGGAEVELSLLFADVRGSTTIAERMSPTDYRELINRFYDVATKVLADSNAMIDKIIGDQASGIYLPGFAGAEHAKVAIESGKEILRVTGHGSKDGPWIPLGVGIHTGIAFVGSLGSGGVTDITVLGDVANTAARLSSRAGVGEILISEAACQHASLDEAEIVEKRELELKGKENRVVAGVYVISPPA